MQNKLDKDFFKLCFNLPPEEAIKFLEKKGLKVSIDWFDLYREEHVRAFTVAGITKLEVLDDIRNALVEAQKNGETLESFKQNIIPKLKQKGWYGNRLVIREDGSEKEVNVSSPWRLKTIYRTNMAVAAMTGLYKELKAASDIMPYWRYVTVGDGRVREEHAKIHGKILRHDDPFWDKYFPPNGYNCRCSVEGITETEFKKKGYKLSDGKSMANLVMPFVKTGWDYNPGKEYYTPDPKDYPEEFKPIAEKINKDAEKALEKLPEIQEDYKADNQLQVPEVIIKNAEELQQNVSYLGKLKDRSEKTILKVLEYWENKFEESEVENALVITKDNKVYKISGRKDRVRPDIIPELDKAIVTHNHPLSVTNYGLSDDDIDLFKDEKLTIVRLIDNGYVYQLTDADGYVDEIIDYKAHEMKEEYFRHWYSAKFAKLNGYGYRRFKHGRKET